MFSRGFFYRVKGQDCVVKNKKIDCSLLTDIVSLLFQPTQTTNNQINRMGFDEQDIGDIPIVTGAQKQQLATNNGKVPVGKLPAVAQNSTDGGKTSKKEGNMCVQYTF